MIDRLVLLRHKLAQEWDGLDPDSEEKIEAQATYNATKSLARKLRALPA